MRPGRRHPASLRRIVAAMVLVSMSGFMATGIASADERPGDVKTMITKWYTHGIPYADAKALGAGAVPELVSMLRDTAMEEHWTKIVWVQIGRASCRERV